MRLASVIACILTVSLGLISFAHPSAAISETRKGHQLSRLKPLSPPAASLLKAREEVLSSLYDQLKAAESKASSVLIASAIEKLWSKSGSDTADLLMERAKLALKAHNQDLAVQLLNAVTEIDPRYIAAWSQLATVYFFRDEYNEAMRKLQRVLALDPRHFKAMEGLGIILRETGNKKAALEVTRRALAVYPYFESARKAERELAREIEGQEICSGVGLI